MYTKLTLNLHEDVIEKAKVYAKKHESSLSKLIEKYLSSIVEIRSEKSKNTPITNELIGIIGNKKLNVAKVKYEHIKAKYS